jgi:hypothetical protein
VEHCGTGTSAARSGFQIPRFIYGRIEESFPFLNWMEIKLKFPWIRKKNEEDWELGGKGDYLGPSKKRVDSGRRNKGLPLKYGHLLNCVTITLLKFIKFIKLFGQGLQCHNITCRHCQRTINLP